MEKEELEKFLKQLLSYYMLCLEKANLIGSIIPSVVSLNEAISFVSRAEFYLVPTDFEVDPIGNLKLTWKTDHRNFIVTFHNNKDVEYSKLSSDGEIKGNYYSYVGDLIYFKDLKEIEIELLNYVEGSSGIFAFKSLLG